MSLAQLRLEEAALAPASDGELQRFVNAGRLAASVAQELLSALGVAQTDVSFLCEALENGEPQAVREAAEDARDAVTRAVSRLGAVLSLARSRKGEVAPLDVREVIGAALFELETRLARNFVARDFQLAPCALAERGGLLQALVSLLLDAADRSPRRGRIEVALRAEGTDVLVTIDDEGHPGPPDDAAGTPLWLSRNALHSFGGELGIGAGPLGGRRATVRLRSAV